MQHNWPHIVLLLMGIVGWLYSSAPLLKFMVFLSEKEFRWALLGWFAAMTISIFLVKLSLFALAGWPSPGSWSSRFFYPLLLFSAPIIPFLNELRKSRKR